ncbi:MAG: phosphoribosylanthranilate isomerase [Dehalococcoidia bacterium]
MTLVKICGISEAKHARAAAAFGADFIGMVFAPSSRQVTIGEAKRIAAGLGKSAQDGIRPFTTEAIEDALGQRRPLLVGVFADQDADTINDIASEVGLDLVPLSGSEPWEVCSHINRPVLKCMKIREGETVGDLRSHLHEGAIVLLDPYVEGTYGGTGRTLDWDVASDIARERPTVLAGGLNPDNVHAAVEQVQPWCVDVSSGVETEGKKDTGKIRAFVQNAKETGRAAGNSEHD